MQELLVPLQTNANIVHLRLFLPERKQEVKIDWIDVGPTDGRDGDGVRWDFVDGASPQENR